MADRSTPKNIALLYAFSGCVWILFSDNLVALFFHDTRTVIWVSELKGWGYVLVTSWLLYWLIKGATQRLVRSEALLRQQGAELERRVADRTEELSRALDDLKKQTDERLRMAEELRIKERMLAQQSRLAAMGEMIGNIAHQWRQPLNALGLTVQQLPLFYQMGELNRELLEESVYKSMKLIKHMSRTIDDFRDFFSPDKEKCEFPVCQAVAKTVEMVRDSLTERRISVEITCHDEPVANGYPNEYSQVLLNILVNARDAFDTRVIASPLIRINVSGDENQAVVTITDNAGGIAPELSGPLSQDKKRLGLRW